MVNNSESHSWWMENWKWLVPLISVASMAILTMVGWFVSKWAAMNVRLPFVKNARVNGKVTVLLEHGVWKGDLLLGRGVVIRAENVSFMYVSTTTIEVSGKLGRYKVSWPVHLLMKDVVKYSANKIEALGTGSWFGDVLLHPCNPEERCTLKPGEERSWFVVLEVGPVAGKRVRLYKGPVSRIEDADMDDTIPMPRLR